MNETLHLVCPHCDTVNRIPAERLREHPGCGRCHRPLHTGQPLDLTAERFERLRTRGDLPLVVDFWAPWCGPCKVMAPAYAQAAQLLEPDFVLGKVNADAEQALAARHGIRSIPTLILFHGGRETARQPGAMSTADIVRWVRMH